MILWITLFLSMSLQGQYNIVNTASRIHGQCYQLTPDSTSGFGQLISRRTHNLNSPLTLYTQMYFGDNDLGGNGIAFFFQSMTNDGMSNDTIYGLDTMSNALAVEFDTHPNINAQEQTQDPVFDHISLHRNNDFSHNSINNLQGPFRANPSLNIEDGTWHPVKIDWNPSAQRLTVLFDCEEVINYQGDIINDIFDGNPNVFFGFSAGSFEVFNTQEVCIELTSQSDLLADISICQGAKTQINAIVGGDTYEWTPSTGLSADNVPNPVASPSENTTYFLEVETGLCDEILNYSIDVMVSDIDANVDIGADTTLCVPDTRTLDASTPNATSYRWSNGTVDSVLTVSRTGRYDVTVTFDDQCVAEDWARITFDEVPSILLPNDTTICIESDGFTWKPAVNAILNVDYSWNNGSTADSLNINRAGFYMVTVESVCGSDDASILVNSESCRNFYMPNAFTPNADGFNDEMYPFTETGDIEQITHFSIYNRWGNMVYLIEDGEPNNRSLGWDGKVNGKPSAEGIYMYKLILKFRDGQETLIKGNFTLLTRGN